MILAVSRDSDPVGNPGSDWKNLKWDRYLIEVAESPNSGEDFPTLGTDDNGGYIAVDHTGNVHATLVAIEKATLMASSPVLNATYIRNIPYGTLQPAVNFDSVPLTGAGWVVTPRSDTYQDIEQWEEE